MLQVRPSEDAACRRSKAVRLSTLICGPVGSLTVRLSTKSARVGEAGPFGRSQLASLSASCPVFLPRLLVLSSPAFVCARSFGTLHQTRGDRGGRPPDGGVKGARFLPACGASSPRRFLEYLPLARLKQFLGPSLAIHGALLGLKQAPLRRIAKKGGQPKQMFPGVHADKHLVSLGR